MSRLGDTYRYKNSIAKPGTNEQCRRNLTPLTTCTGGSSLISSSATHLGFVSGFGSGGDVVVTSLGDPQRSSVVRCHGDAISDVSFSPFDSCLFGTVSKDESLKLWKLGADADGLSHDPAFALTLSEPLIGFQWHKAASGIIATGKWHGQADHVKK
jgi:WD40 repeat protein